MQPFLNLFSGGLNKFMPQCRAALFSILTALLLLLCFGPAAWSRGGGGGGGHGGGFGGGHFGGGGFGGGYGGSHYYGGYGGYGGNYYGGGNYYHSYYGYNAANAVLGWILGIAAVLIVCVAIANIWHARKSLVAITMVLKNGRQYTSTMQQFTTQGRFDDPSSRTVAAHEVVHLIHDIDIFVGSVHVANTGMDGADLGEQAKMLWQEEMRRGEIKADVINVASPSGKMKANFGPAPADPEAVLEHEDGYCLLSIIVTASGIWSNSTNQRGDVVNAIHRLASSEIDALYFYYTPSAGIAISRGDAISVLEKLSAIR